MLSLTPEEKQHVREVYLRNYPSPSIYGMADQSNFSDILMELGYLPKKRIEKVLDQYRKDKIATPEVHEIGGLLMQAVYLYNKIIPSRSDRISAERERRGDSASNFLCEYSSE